MLYRGIEVSYESIREWCQKFGQHYANQLRRKRPYIADKWHLDEVVVTIKKQHPKQHELSAKRYREQLHQRIADWREIAGLNSAG